MRWYHLVTYYYEPNILKIQRKTLMKKDSQPISGNFWGFSGKLI